jgi:hypothetical protein
MGIPVYLIGGALLVIPVAVLLVTLRADNQAAVSAGSPQAGGAGMGAPPPLTGTPREQADRLFNRIMQERESGDTARARFFLPMAITAYQNAAPLDADGLYHLSVLQTYAGDAASGSSTAEQIIAADPLHLLGLHAAATAALARNDRTAAGRFYQRLLDAYPSQRSRDLPEYRDHGGLLTELEAEARAFLGK